MQGQAILEMARDEGFQIAQTKEEMIHHVYEYGNDCKRRNQMISPVSVREQQQERGLRNMLRNFPENNISH
jgi:hypothetical protein